MALGEVQQQDKQKEEKEKKKEEKTTNYGPLRRELKLADGGWARSTSSQNLAVLRKRREKCSYQK